MSAAPVPQRIHRADDAITFSWTDDHEGVFPARALRLACQCASCCDELTGRLLLDEQTVPLDVGPVAVHLVGAYAVRVDWSDGHGTGIYTYEFLLAHCPCARCTAARGD
jgi:ATP-binding protein involved in chromosome partitioning